MLTWLIALAIEGAVIGAVASIFIDGKEVVCDEQTVKRAKVHDAELYGKCMVAIDKAKEQAKAKEAQQ